ncbi:uncharacterized protein LOC115269851 [Aedes albopictus]|uniref:CCHC-type domain-containing protein n=1 Tax=Aedes albopictus TaxID=7160 RepID=A0ABM1YWD0_AEDAL
MSGGVIENSVKFCFPLSAPRPTWAEIAAFLKSLDSSVTDMEAVYKMGDDRSLRIKFRNAAAMEDALHKNDGVLKFKYVNGKSVDVRMLPAGVNIQYVRIFDVPPEVTDDDLLAVISKFGKVQRLVREKFPPELGLDHLFTGVRGLFMEVEENIPPTLDVLNWKAIVFYEELRNKCFLCHSEGHRKNTCPQRETQQGKRRTTVAERVACTYAQVVADAGAASEEQKAEEQPEVEEQKGCKNVNEPVYKSEYERNLAENWAKYEAEKRKRQEEYRKNEKSMQRRYKEGLQAKEKAQMEHWEKCEAERKSRQEKYRRDLSRQREAQSVVEQVQSPPKKSSRKQ